MIKIKGKTAKIIIFLINIHKKHIFFFNNEKVLIVKIIKINKMCKVTKPAIYTPTKYYLIIFGVNYNMIFIIFD